MPGNSGTTVNVGPSLSTSIATPSSNIGAPASYTAITSSGLTNFSITTFNWKVNTFSFVSGKVIFTGAGGPASDITVSLPAGQLMNTQLMTHIAATNQGFGMLGYGYWFQQGSGWLFTNANVLNSTTMMFTINTQHLQMSQFANGDSLNFLAEWIPVF